MIVAGKCQMMFPSTATCTAEDWQFEIPLLILTIDFCFCSKQNQMFIIHQRALCFSRATQSCNDNFTTTIKILTRSQLNGEETVGWRGHLSKFSYEWRWHVWIIHLLTTFFISLWEPESASLLLELIIAPLKKQKSGESQNCWDSEVY